MKIRELKVTKENFMELILDPNVFVIKNGFLGCYMRPIKECSFEELFGENADYMVIEIKISWKQ